MKWITLNDIKDQLRLEREFTDEDTLLTRYGNAAEQFVLNYLCRTEEELKAMNADDPTKVPEDIIQGTLIIVDAFYQYRGPFSTQNLYLVDYGFDALVSWYRKPTLSSVRPND